MVSSAILPRVSLSPRQGELILSRLSREKVTRRAEEKRRSGPPPISIARPWSSSPSARSLARSFVLFFSFFSCTRRVVLFRRRVGWSVLVVYLLRSWLCKRRFDWFVPMHHPFGLVKPDRLASGEGGSRADATGRPIPCSCYGQLVPVILRTGDSLTQQDC